MCGTLKLLDVENSSLRRRRSGNSRGPRNASLVQSSTSAVSCKRIEFIDIGRATPERNPCSGNPPKPASTNASYAAGFLIQI